MFSIKKVANAFKRLGAAVKASNLSYDSSPPIIQNKSKQIRNLVHELAMLWNKDNAYDAYLKLCTIAIQNPVLYHEYIIRNLEALVFFASIAIYPGSILKWFDNVEIVELKEFYLASGRLPSDGECIGIRHLGVSLVVECLKENGKLPYDM